MSLNLLDTLTGVFNNDLISKAASALGESEGSISKTVSAAVPSLLSGILNTAKSDGAANLMKLAGQANDSGILDNIGSLFGGSNSSSLLNMGSSLLSNLMGNKAMGLTSLISAFTGSKQSTTNSILSAIAPIALSYIGKQIISNKWSASGLMDWLTGQKNQINNAIPAGLNINALFEPTSGARPMERTLHAETKKPSTNWILPLILGLVGLGLLWYFLKGCNDTPTTPVTTDTIQSTTVVPEAPATVPARELFKVTLPDGTILDAYKGGIEDKLVAFLNDANAQAGKDVWFDFDNLNFETGSAALTAESQAQVKNIAAILKAYPKLKIKIGGYTDNSGDAAANKTLSQNRANAVLEALKTAGSSTGQLTGAEGYGSEFAKVPATASDEERRSDRRISVGVREK